MNFSAFIRTLNTANLLNKESISDKFIKLSTKEQFQKIPLVNFNDWLNNNKVKDRIFHVAAFW